MSGGVGPPADIRLPGAGGEEEQKLQHDDPKYSHRKAGSLLSFRQLNALAVVLVSGTSGMVSLFDLFFVSLSVGYIYFPRNTPMASLSLLQSTVSSFPGRSLLLSAPHSVRAPRNVVMAPVRAEADPIVLVDKADNEKVDRLKTNYLEKIVPLLMEEFKYENIHQVPKVTKIVVNCGMGEAASNSKGLDAAINDLASITGQRPVKTIARNSVAAFKIREGQTLGIAVTLRGDIMYAFLDRLINLGLPRSRDFQGVSPYSFDGHGNYSLGLSDQGVFPDLKFSLQGRNQGMDVCISTTAKNDKEGHKLLSLMGMPFKAGVVDSGAGEQRKKKLKAHHFSTKGAGRSRR